MRPAAPLRRAPLHRARTRARGRARAAGWRAPAANAPGVLRTRSRRTVPLRPPWPAPPPSSSTVLRLASVERGAPPPPPNPPRPPGDRPLVVLVLAGCRSRRPRDVMSRQARCPAKRARRSRVARGRRRRAAPRSPIETLFYLRTLRGAHARLGRRGTGEAHPGSAGSGSARASRGRPCRCSRRRPRWNGPARGLRTARPYLQTPPARIP